MGLGTSRPPAKMIIVGLDNSGKSTVINYLKPKKIQTQETVPTVGFNVENFKHGSLKFTVWDMSGAGRYRSLWEHYYEDAQAIVFVIDSADTVRMCVVKDELESLLAHKYIAKNPVPILFFANKSDLTKALKANELAEILELSKMTDRNVHIQASNALSGEGLSQGMAWIESQLPR